jgi:hypothetical protein
VNGGHLLLLLLLLLTRRSGAAVRTPVLVRRLPASGHRHKRGLAQPLFREFTGHSDAQDQSRSRLRTARRAPQRAEVAPHERQLHHRQETTGQLLKACGDPPVLLEPPHQTLDHIAPSVGRPAESRRTPASPATLARRDTLLGDHTAGTATAQVSTEGTRIITSIRHHQLRAADPAAARRTGLYPHIRQQFCADGALMLLSWRKDCRQRVTQTVAHQVQFGGKAATGAT